MKIQKVTLVSMAAVSACSMMAGILTFAAKNDVETKDISMQNSFICLSVEQDENQGEYLRYRLDSTGGQTANKDDDNKNLTYHNFFSNLTTININGQNYIYGKGTDVSEPSFNAAEKCHTSSQKFGDVVIEQKLSFAEGFTEGCEDMLKVSYKVLSASENDLIGVRIVIDPMLDNDDEALLSVNSVDIKNESVFNEEIPKEWGAVKKDNINVSAFGKTDGVPVMPDSIIFSNWDSLYDSLWDYEPDINKVIKDAAAAVKWNPSVNSVDKEFATYYGIKNGADFGGNNNVKVNSPKTGIKFPAVSIALGAVSIITATGCIIMKRREKNDEK